MKIVDRLFNQLSNWIERMIPDPPPMTAPIGPTKFVRPVNPDRTPDIFVGKIIDDGSIKCEVVAHHNKNNMHVKILEIKWDRLGTYLDAGKIYPIFKHRGWNDASIQVWEISPKRMKRSTSQVILQWESGVGWTWDLDM